MEELFQSKPETVLAYFQTVGLMCLNELDLYVQLKKRRPQAAAKIVFIAATLGIPESCDEPELREN
jgi:hypothetical protein